MTKHEGLIGIISRVLSSLGIRTSLVIRHSSLGISHGWGKDEDEEKDEDYPPTLPILRAHFLHLRAALFRFENALLQAARPLRSLPPFFLDLRAARGAFFVAPALDRVEQPVPRELAVHRLR